MLGRRFALACRGCGRSAEWSSAQGGDEVEVVGECDAADPGSCAGQASEARSCETKGAYLAPMKPLYAERNGVRNRLLGRLPAEDFRRLWPRLEPADLKPRSPLYDPRVPFAHVYLPETGIGSIVTVSNDGTEAEVATIGRGGMLGLTAF